MEKEEDTFFNAFNVDTEVKQDKRPQRCETCRRVPVNDQCLCIYLPQPHPIPLTHANELNIIILQHSDEAREFKVCELTRLLIIIRILEI
jgi:hypothetical protein